METPLRACHLGMVSEQHINSTHWTRDFNSDTNGSFSGVFPDGNYSSTEATAGGEEEEADCRVYNFIVSGVLLGICCLIGYIGNILTVITLSQQRKTGTRVLLQSLAVVDTCLLIPAFFVKFIPNCCLYTARYGQACFTFWFSIYPFMACYLWPIGTIAHFSSVWIIVLVTGNRYVVVCRPLQAKALARVCYIHTQLAIVVILGTLYSIPRFFEYEIHDMIHPSENVTIYITSTSDFFKDKTYQILYRNVSFFLVMNIVPLIVITVFTIFLVREVWRARKLRQVLTKSKIMRSSPSPKRGSQSEDSSLTFTLIMVVVVFFVCQVPAAVTRVFVMISPDTGSNCGEFDAFFSHLSDFLVFLNSSVNFIIYCVCSSTFRRDLRTVFTTRGPCCSCIATTKCKRYSSGTNSSLHRSFPTVSPQTNGKTFNISDVKRTQTASPPSLTSFPSVIVISLGDDDECVVPRHDQKNGRWVSQETVITHL